jgi:hypothetical protein
VPNPAITTKAQAAFYGDVINKSPSPAAAAEQIVSLQNTYGPYFPKVMSELVQKHEKGGGGIDKSLQIAGFLTDKDALTRVIENSRNGLSISQNFQEKYGASKGGFLLATINERLSPVTNAINGNSSDGDNAALAHSINLQVKLEAKKILLSEGGDPGTKEVQSAVDRATQRIIGDNFSLVSDGRSSVFVPNNVQGANPEVVKGFIGHYSTPESLQEFKPATPPAYHDKRFYEDKTAGDKAALQDLAKNHRWVPTSDHMGVMLAAEDSKGNLNAVPDVNGQPIIKTFKDMSINPSPGIIDRVLSAPKRIWNW